jgi:hypothetical protein
VLVGLQQHRVFDAHGARDEVLVGRERGLLGRDQAGVDLFLQQRMVARDLLQAPGAQAVARESPTWPSSSRLSRKTATTSVVPMPAYCGLELAALKMARLALSTQMSIARRTSASLAWDAGLAQPAAELGADEGGGHVAGHFAGVVATHAVGQHGQGHAGSSGDRVLVVAARPARVHGGVRAR